MCVCIADSLCCGAETNTPLWSNYTPIKMLLKKNKSTVKMEGIIFIIKVLILKLITFNSKISTWHLLFFFEAILKARK